MKYLLYGLILSIVPSINGMHIMHSADGFSVVHEGKVHPVKMYFVDKELRNISSDNLRAYFNAGCGIRAAKMDSGEFALHRIIPGKGGGPFTAIVAGIGTAIVGAGGTLVATVASIPAVGLGCVFVLSAGAAATTKATIVAAAAGMAAPLP